MNVTLVGRALRGVAVAIAIVAIIDPAILVSRPIKPVVVVVALDSARDAALADHVANTVTREFLVSRTPIAGASASVIVGDRLPSARDDYPPPTFAVVADTATPSVSIERVDVPANVPPDARVPVMVQVAVHGSVGRLLDVSLRAGSSAVDRTSVRFTTSDSTLIIPLSFVPSSAGAIPVRVTATMNGASSPAIADEATNVRERRWAVLFFDPRPSWTSTFVRRAIERDPRFIVTSRVVTSRGVSTDAGHPPATLNDSAGLSLFDVVVVGAPEGLSPEDIAGLDRFMRRRGGSVVLLLDQRVAGPYDRLTGVAKWASRTTGSTTLASAQRDSLSLRATEIAWPSVLPPGATRIAGGPRPVVWASPAGAGHLIVSGALDAWRFRDPSSSSFDRFWRMLIADGANASPLPVSATVSHAIVAPGEVVDVHAVIRDAALAPAFAGVADSRRVHASIAATLGSGRRPGTADPEPLRLWPEPDVGQFRGTVRAPRATGVYQIAIIADGATTHVPLIVGASVQHAAPSARELLTAWVTAHRGRILHATEMSELLVALRAAVRPPSRIENWHPMRSGWWIFPFVLTLSGEWWLRRRRGLR